MMHLLRLRHKAKVHQDAPYPIIHLPWPVGPVRRHGLSPMFMTFTYTLAGGMLAILATGRQRDLAWRFVRLVGLIVFALVCIGTAWNVRASGLHSIVADELLTICILATAAGALGVALLAPLEIRCTRVFIIICGLGGLAGVVAGCASLIATFGDRLASPFATGMAVTGQVLSAMLLGSVTVAWLLGHAYLTATKMTVAPLHHFSRMLSWAVAIRAMFVPVSLTAAWLIAHDADPSILSGLISAWLVLSLRVGVGLAALGAFAYMVADCVRLRSTQSATGILYFGSIFAYVGELASWQLIAECGWAV